MKRQILNLLMLVMPVALLLFFLFPLPGYESPFISAMNVHPVFGVFMLLTPIAFLVSRIVLYVKKW